MNFPPFLKIWRLAVPATLLALTLAQVVNVDETFKKSTAPDWSITNNASLTSGGIDPADDGWLRLTSASRDQVGNAIYNKAFSSFNGIKAEFEYATYGGNGADGFTFCLVDGSVSPTPGAPGGSLGYSSGRTAAGVAKGYVGIAFDEYGNFSNAGYGACAAPMPCRQTPNTVAVRGSGDSQLGTAPKMLTRCWPAKPCLPLLPPTALARKRSLSRLPLRPTSL